jgi:hypothetical protein
MTETQGTPPLSSALRDAVAGDLRPVAPLAPPARRTIALVPIALVLLVLSSALFGLRVDSPRLGLLLTWGASVLQMAFALLVIVAALREAVPGTLLPRHLLQLLLGAAVAGVVALTWITWLVSPTTIRPQAVVFVWQVCVAGTYVSALPALAVAAWLVRRAYPLRPWIAGALCGLGAGLLADAGWRLFCHFSDPSHVLGAHALAILLATLTGAASARWLRR